MRRRYGFRAGVPIDDYRNELRNDFDPFAAMLRGVDKEIEATYTRLTELKWQRTSIIADRDANREDIKTTSGEIDDELFLRWKDASWRDEGA